MGHAARLVPIANELHTKGAQIFICAHGAALDLMQLECPYAQFVEDIPLEIEYSKHAWYNGLKLISQLPKMLLQVYREHSLLKQLVVKYNIDLVIADNRYGLYHKTIPCIFVTHQLNIQVPYGKGIVNFFNHYFIKKFASCWVPDFEDEQSSIAGVLSKNERLRNVKYIGPLSRAIKAKSTNEIKAPVLYLLSGIEPQRSILEAKIIAYHSMHPHQAIIIRGTVHAKEKIIPKADLIVYEICDAKQLQSLVNASKFIVCRSGYSSIMDLIAWQKNAVLIPTPNQPEQVYLAKYLHQKKWFYHCEQNHFNQFNEAVINDFKCPILPFEEINYDRLIDSL